MNFGVYYYGKSPVEELKNDETTIDGAFKHYHKYVIDENGGGQTFEPIFTEQGNDGKVHGHVIMNYEVEMGGFDCHTHKISARR